MIIIYMIILLFPSVIIAQFQDDFSDGNFTVNPAWFGDVDKYIVDSNNELRINSSGKGSSNLYTTSLLSANVRWEFRVNMEYTPSSSNYTQVYLAVGDYQSASSKIYFVNIGRNKRRIELFYFDGIKNHLILSSEENHIKYEGVEIDLVIEKIEDKWTLKSKKISESEYNLSLETKFAVAYFESKYFGISTHYTSTRAKKTSFDNFNISEIYVPDITPPVLTDIKIINEEEVKITFNEKVKFLSKKSIKISPDIGIKSIKTDDSISFKISLNPKLKSGNKYTVKLDNIYDFSDNKLGELSKTLLFYIPKENDVIINEIMYDPVPRVNLPDAEYIELYNNTQGIVEMKEWKLTIGVKEYIIENTTLFKGEYLLITKKDEGSLFDVKKVLKINFSSLNNTRASLKIETSEKKLINQVEYSADWIMDEIKKDGGWSIELINPRNYSYKKGNWKASLNENGGTPGSENSVLDFKYFFKEATVLKTFYTNDNISSLHFIFYNYLDENTVNIISNYRGNFEVSSSNNADGTSNINIYMSNDSVRELTYFKFDGLQNLEGESVKIDTIWIDKYKDVEKKDIIINEIMYSPKEGSSEFVEIYNNSDKFISLRGFYISNFSNDGENIKADNEKRITNDNLVFAPHDYYVISKDRLSIGREYRIASLVKFIDIPTMPKMNDEKGNIALIDKSLNYIDKIMYDRDMQIPLLVEEKRKGVSLERIKASNPSLDRNNWTSSAQNNAGATPGFINSVTPKDVSSTSMFKIIPEVFTPNSDGINDISQIIYNMDKPKYIANVKVFDANGIFIKEISNNYLMGIKGSFIWNGTDYKNRISPKGIYVYWIEIFDLEGNVSVYKKVIVLG